MRILVTGATGFIGSHLVPRLLADGHEVRAFARDPARVPFDIPVVRGDVLTGAGLGAALDGVDAAYYLIHSMEPGAGGFEDRDRRAAERFRAAAGVVGLPRLTYLGGLVPPGAAPSAHLASRLEVEEILLEAAPVSTALRASIVIGAGSRSFRFLVRLVERMPVMPLPPWRDLRTQPIDVRDVMAYLVAASSSRRLDGPASLDIAGPDVLTYGEIVDRIRHHLLVGRPALHLPVSVTPIASRVASVIAGEDHELIGPLMEGLTSDLLPRDERVRELLPIRRHSFDAAVERALREWERDEELAAR